MQLEGFRIRFVRSIFVPEDEACLQVYEATSAADVHIAASRAAIEVERLTEAIAPSARDKDGDRS
jgi:hypothetical protein